MLLVTGAAALRAQPEAVLHASPEGSDAWGDGTPASPFRSIRRALLAAGRAPSRIVLAAGSYSPASGERFPLEAREAPSFTLEGPGPGGPGQEAARIEGGEEEALLDLAGEGPGGSLRARVEGVELRGGLSGLVAAGGAGSRLEVELVGCRFVGQRCAGAELSVGPGGSGRISARSNELDGAAVFGLDIAVGSRGELELELEGNRVAAGGAFPQGGPSIPRFGLALYVDAAARARGWIRRSHAAGLPVGLLVVESEREGDRGSLDLTVSSSLFGVGAGQEILHGLQLFLRPAYDSRLRLLQSTIRGARGFAIHEPEPVLERTERVEVEVAGCILWDLSGEVWSGAAPGARLPPYYRLRGNIAPPPAPEGNSGEDPLLQEDGVPGLASPALDRLVLPAWGERDAAGRCRVADGDGDGTFLSDLGALERPGACLEDERDFSRGDASGDGRIDISDAVAVLDHLFQGRPAACLDALDTNDDGAVDLSDAIACLSYLFLAGKPPPPPHPGPGRDPTGDRLGPCK